MQKPYGCIALGIAEECVRGKVVRNSTSSNTKQLVQPPLDQKVQAPSSFLSTKIIV